jgi:hypothetical protein
MTTTRHRHPVEGDPVITVAGSRPGTVVHPWTITPCGCRWDRRGRLVNINPRCPDAVAVTVNR